MAHPVIPIPGVSAPANHTSSPIQPPSKPQAHVINQQATELATLQAHLAQLEQGTERAPPHPATPACHVPPVLFADQGTIDRAKAAAVASRDSDKKPSLPEIVPGFKASPLDIREYHSFFCFFSSRPSRMLKHPLYGVHPLLAIGHTDRVNPFLAIGLTDWVKPPLGDRLHSVRA